MKFIDKSFAAQSTEVQEYRLKIKDNPTDYQKDIINALIKFSEEIKYSEVKMAELFGVSKDTYRRWISNRYIPKYEDYKVACYIVHDYLAFDNYHSENNCHNCLQNIRLEMNRMIDSMEERIVKSKST